VDEVPCLDAAMEILYTKQLDELKETAEEEETENDPL
jgi:hypothetical protein